MKKRAFFLVVVLTGLFSLPVFSQTDNEPVALGLPGDNLNLYAVLDIFQKSKTLEDFEKALNDPDNKVNNLDLNNDGEIDYIEIESHKEGNTHVIVLQVAVNNNETQDVAVIEVDKDKKNNVHVQAIGDEDLYGKNYIVEPSGSASGTPNPGYTGGSTVIVNNNTTNNYTTTTTSPGYVSASVSAWPVILFLFSPVYVAYRSPWHWGYYPPYWRPWRPVYYHDYWGYHGHYYRSPYYRRTAVIRNPRYYNNYAARRNTSVVVRDNRTNGRYNTTYNGRDYKRPAPVTRPSRPGNTTRPTTRPTNPSTRPGNTTRPTNPSTRPGNTTRPTNPSTRPGNNTRPTTRPVTPTNPSTRPVVRPAQPVTRPATRPVTPTAPSTRPAVRPTAPSARPATQPTTRPATPRPASGGSNRR
ncbi:hypothetical protein B0A67_12795 [Flavobacterium aquidurense]|jgi:hypothetical protein|uniref:hypothetical protein n=1 Tax=Flavobacterium aquidurense TaxID=362413 RepID=UPI000921BD1D|nr:hypothetical protein [Flavobacterium aquidurense]OXA71140.1 hypothetical protein B0A67_12795 [Flavobacterium aquidurense]SHG65662.1 hypothetical protein SAMN05444481_106103 [Flavobacterium frigidimaris]